MFVCTECGSAQPFAGRCAADGTELSPIGEDVLLGTTIGVYRVARLLGIGGMGRVYKGVHPTIGSRVAIKVLSRECSDRRELVERFFAEAKAVNLIRHESIVNVLDLATLPDGRPYIIMEYLDGAPLSALIEDGVQHQVPLPLGGIARLAAEVLDALGAAHGKNIVHRDLKPDNIFVAPSGRPKILDFGIAKLSDATNTSTRTGSLLGTPHYMSPEQAAGRVVDQRADIYAMGVILFECATGRKPFLADALFELLRMHVEAPPPSPRAFRPDMPPALEQVILTALAKAPDQRFSTAMAMSMALQHATAQLAPDQWRPLTPPSARSSASSSWAPTPPVSWSGRASQASHGGQATVPQRPGAGHTPGNLPSHTPGQLPSHTPGNVSTVSSGQVATAAGAKSSRAGLWITLGVLSLVAGGATVGALVAGGGDDDGSAGSAVAQAGSGSSGAPAATDAPAGTPAAPDAPAGTPAAQGSAAAPVRDTWGGATGSAATPSATGSAAHDGDEPDPEALETAEHAAEAAGAAEAAAQQAMASEAMNAALAQLDQTIGSLPPDQQKRLAMYKGLSKLPPKERLKRLRELSLQGMSLQIPGVEAPDAAKAPQVVEAPPPAAPAPGAWVTMHDLDPPAGYDPARVDVTAFVPWAVAQARKAIPDAQLIRIDADGVSPDGRANLNLPSHASDHGSIDVRFISPSRGKRDPKLPLGVARRDFKCEFRIMATPEGVEMTPINFADCSKEHVVPVPRCGASGVWKKAIARKAPSQNAVGNLGYRSNGSKPVWYFAIGSGFDVAFSEMFGDDC